MYIILLNINKDLCNKCGYCIADCPSKTIMKDENNFPYEKEENFCIRCGHCEAICPNAAIEIVLPELESSYLKTEKVDINGFQMAYLMQMRRSVRAFKNITVEKEKIEHLLEIARYAPTAGNGQYVKWMVIYDNEELKKLTETIIEQFKKLISSNNELSQKYNFQVLVDAWNKGVNPIFRQAPHLALTYAPKKSMMPLIDSTIALTYFDLALPSLGLGGTWAGYFYMVAQFYPELTKVLGLSEDYMITGGIMFGYPKFEYCRVPKRKKQTVLWK